MLGLHLVLLRTLSIIIFDNCDFIDFRFKGGLKALGVCCLVLCQNGRENQFSGYPRKKYGVFWGEWSG